MNDDFKRPRGRRSRALWQELVDSAEALLMIDSCRQYGLITGGPECNHERCRQILEDGKRRRITPRPDAVERFIAALHAEEDICPLMHLFVGLGKNIHSLGSGASMV